MAYWRLEGNSNDASGRGHNGTDSSITYSTGNGKFNTGAGFSSSSITIPASGDFNFTDKFSITFWAKTNATSGNHMGLMKNSGGTLYWYIWFPTGSNIEFNTRAGSGGLNYAHSLDTDWHHWAFTYDVDGGSNNRRIYMDGDVVAQDTSASSPLGDSADLTIGNWSTYPYDGAFDDFAIFHKALSSTEVSQLYTGSWGGGSVSYRNLLGVGI